MIPHLSPFFGRSGLRFWVNTLERKRAECRDQRHPALTVATSREGDAVADEPITHGFRATQDYKSAPTAEDARPIGEIIRPIVEATVRKIIGEEAA